MSRIMVIILSVLTFCLATRNGYSQNLHTLSNKALKAYNQGVEAYDFLNYESAEALFHDAISSDKQFYEAYVMLGELYTKQNRFKLAAENYRIAITIDSLSYEPLFFALAEAEIKTGDYQNALVHYKTYLRYKSGSEKNRAIAAKNIKNCEFAIEALKQPVPFNPENIGSSINSSDDEYWPSITADGQTLMFTRQSFYRTPGPFSRNTSQEDFYVSFLSDSGWSASINAGAPLNTNSNEGAQTLSSSGNYMYFTACERTGGIGSCDIYFSAFSNGKWSIPYNLGSPVNSPLWESTPSINADGTMLLFSSNRPGGSGGKDLWYSILKDNATWSEPENLGNIVNTPGEEMSPFLHFDGRTLYFASDGRPGMGGYDIYMSRMNDDSTWTEPRNLGYPINTSGDDMGLVIETTGQKAYFSSKRENSSGKDIFFFNLDESIRPIPVSYLKGKVTDKETGKVLKAKYELINLSTNKVTARNSTDDSGNFLVCLPSGNNYGLNVTKPGYLFYSENFMFEGIHTAIKPFLKRIALSPARVGEKITLTNVFYEIDSWELKKESIAELNTLKDLLKENMNLVVEIGGFTDSTGTAEHNLVLSEKRALSVVNYLIDNGISSGRLTYKGYGNSSPIGDNVTSEGRRLNRRTEARIIGLEKK